MAIPGDGSLGTSPNLLIAPPQGFEPITPNDTAGLVTRGGTAYATRYIMAGTTGTIAAVGVYGTAITTMSGLAVGQLTQMRVTQVMATGTSASNLTGFF